MQDGARQMIWEGKTKTDNLHSEMIWKHLGVKPYEDDYRAGKSKLDMAT